MLALNVRHQKFPFRNFYRTKFLRWRAQVGGKWKLNEQPLWWCKKRGGGGVIMEKKYQLNQRKPLNVSFLAIAKKRLVLQSRNFFFFFFFFFF